MKDGRSTYVRSQAQRPRQFKKNPKDYYTPSDDQVERGRLRRKVEEMRDAQLFDDHLKEVWE